MGEGSESVKCRKISKDKAGLMLVGMLMSPSLEVAGGRPEPSRKTEVDQRETVTRMGVTFGTDFRFSVSARAAPHALFWGELFIRQTPIFLFKTQGFEDNIP